jgi:uncharacterized hydantoinase/oxoprolinase family protein
VLPAQAVTGVASELGQEGALRTPVAFAERVQRVDLGEQRAEAVEEAVAITAAEVVCLGEAPKTSAAVDSIWDGRQNDAPALTMSTVRSCPANG